MAWTAGAILTAADLNTYLPQARATWTSPITGGITVGNGTTSAFYTQVGKLVHADLHFTLGTTSAITGDVTLDLPVDASTSSGAQGVGWLNDGGTRYPAHVFSLGTTGVIVRAINVGGTYAVHAVISSTVPFTWGTGDEIHANIVYLGV